MLGLRIACITLCSLLPLTALAQTPRAVEEWPQSIAPKQRVAITDIGGDKHRGSVIGVTPDSITLREDGRTRTFERAIIAEVRRGDRLWDGMLIGAGAGFLATEIWSYQLCGPRGYDTECSAIVTGVGWMTFVPGGTAVGALIDKFTGNQLIYRRGRRNDVAVSPVVTPTARAAMVTIRF
jgi:hypothetical protein